MKQNIGKNGKIESKEIILGLCNWASTCLSNIHYSCGLVWLLRSKPQTEPNCAVQCKSHPNSSEPCAVFCGFGLDWVGLWFFYCVGSVLNTLISNRCYTVEMQASIKSIKQTSETNKHGF